MSSPPVVRFGSLVCGLQWKVVLGWHDKQMFTFRFTAQQRRLSRLQVMRK
jgi:hypothetical protein